VSAADAVVARIMALAAIAARRLDFMKVISVSFLVALQARLNLQLDSGRRETCKCTVRESKQLQYASIDVPRVRRLT
jgi:hypothetical protein